jgi:hypothetical protein
MGYSPLFSLDRYSTFVTFTATVMASTFQKVIVVTDVVYSIYQMLL